MVECGMSPLQAMLATTRSAAELVGVSDDQGTIEAGKRADLVVVSGDPFDYADLAARVTAVYQDGRLVSGAA
jgi:imidazolonepropionase-like amidohydrolase